MEKKRIRKGWYKLALFALAAGVMMRGPALLDQQARCLCNRHKNSTGLYIFEINHFALTSLELDNGNRVFATLVLPKFVGDGVGCNFNYVKNLSQDILVGIIDANAPHAPPNPDILKLNFCPACQAQISAALQNPLYDILLLDTEDHAVYGFVPLPRNLYIREYFIQVEPDDENKITFTMKKANSKTKNQADGK